jgi:hypothetical protein
MDQGDGQTPGLDMVAFASWQPTILRRNDIALVVGYEWVPRELLGVERSRRADPASPFQRFRALPFSDLLTGLDVVFDFHRSAAELGWVAVDFYDGAIII